MIWPCFMNTNHIRHRYSQFAILLTFILGHMMLRPVAATLFLLMTIFVAVAVYTNGAPFQAPPF